MQKQHPLKIFQASYGLSVDQLAKKFNKTQPTISRWFTDESGPTQKDYLELQQHFDFDVVVDLFKEWATWLQNKRKD